MSREEKIVTERYYVDGIVCDYGVFDRLSYEEENKLVCICNSHKNALTIAEILNTDYYPDEKGFVAVWKDKQLAELKAEVKDLKFVNRNLEQALKVAPNANAGQRKRIDELTQQLKEKDEEIEKLRNKVEKLSLKATSFKKIIEDENEKDKFIKTNTHQVCEKIRKLSQGLWYFVLEEQKEYFGENRYVLSEKDFNDILDQIEKGEE